MRFGILCVGSHGDILPYVALGVKLKAEGHSVCIATHKKAQTLCKDYDLDFALVEGDLTELSHVQKNHDILNFSPFKKLAAFRFIMKLFKENLRQQLESSLAATKGIDVLIYSPAAFAGPHLAEYYQIRAFKMPLQPGVRTKELPSCIISLPKCLGHFGHLIGHIITEQMLWQPIAFQINQWRKEKLNIRKMHFWGPTKDPYSRNICQLVAFSPFLIPPPSDWASHIHMTGFLRLPSKAMTWLPPKDLQTFLRDGGLPIYIGFGSLSETCPKEIVEAIIRVLKKKKIKALIQNTLPGINEMELPGHIFVVPYTPHELLFPHVKAVVHHGGVGTTAAGLYAGKPTLVMPFLLDQFFWAKKISEWGIGPESLPIKRCDEKTFEASLKKLLTDSSYEEKAMMVMTNLLKEEDGAEVAYRTLESYLLQEI